jgi:alginate O-acetyltransferase complex protein AlgI
VKRTRFFRIELPENFDRPFSSESFLIFWSRWHMTLSKWLKTYVYDPSMLAAASRITAPALTPYIAVLAYFITFFLMPLARPDLAIHFLRFPTRRRHRH